MREGGPRPGGHSRWLLTRGIQALGTEAVAEVIQMVRSFSQFSAENDPYGEHDMGSVEYAGRQVFWKIDYYDRSLQFRSPNAADESVTCRVLTVMLSEEY
jgi:hypothetical protein